MTTQLYRSGETAVTVRDPDVPIDKTVIRVGSTQRMLDGSATQRNIATKWAWSLTWSLLSDTEYATLEDEIQRTVAMKFNPPDEDPTYDVVIVGDPKVQLDGYCSHKVQLDLEEI